MTELEFKEEWKVKTYEWPVTDIPSAGTVAQIAKLNAARGGRTMTEPHADRGELMIFPNGAIPGTSIRKQITRCECRRRALIGLPERPKTADQEHGRLKACVVCDAAQLWPNMTL